MIQRCNSQCTEPFTFDYFTYNITSSAELFRLFISIISAFIRNNSAQIDSQKKKYYLY